MDKKISIITVNLNNAEGLGKTIESVISQNYNKIEYIVIDGESEDNSVQIIESHKNKIYYWSSKKDTGIFQAMNKGIKKSTGEYLLFLNSGDFLVDKNTIAKVFKEPLNEDILCGQNLISIDGQKPYVTGPPPEFSLKYFCSRNIPHQSTFIKRKVFENYGFYNEDFKMKGDYEFWIRTIIKNGVSTKNLGMTISNYNLEGISANIENQEIAKMEMKKALRLNVPESILKDYKFWFESPEKAAISEWYLSHKRMFSILYLGYLPARGLNKLKKLFKRK